MNMETRLFLDWMNFGYGYELLAGEIRETAIILKEPKKVQEGIEQNRILEAKEISSHKNLISILNWEPFNSMMLASTRVN
jgi:hypothetical protein